MSDTRRSNRKRMFGFNMRCVAAAIPGSGFWHAVFTRKTPPIPQERIVSPEYRAGFWSSLTFHWIGPLLATGFARPLERNDIYLVSPDRKSEVLGEGFRADLNQRAARDVRFPVQGALYNKVRWEFWVGGTCMLYATLCNALSPVLLRYLLQFAADAYYASRSDSAAPPISHGVGLVIGVVLMEITETIATSRFLYCGMVMGGKARTLLTNVIFEQSLHMSGRERTDTAPVAKSSRYSPWLSIRKVLPFLREQGIPTSGAKEKSKKGAPSSKTNVSIVNLISVDAARIEGAAGTFHFLWSLPVHAAISLVVLCVNLGYSALAGYTLLVFVLPLLTHIIRLITSRKKKINAITDLRVNLIQEVTQSIRSVKYFAWEAHFLARLRVIREREARAIRNFLAIRNSVNASSTTIPVFASMLAFVVYATRYRRLSTAEVFSSLAIFNSLRMPLSLFPLAVGQFHEGRASLERIQSFVLLKRWRDPIIQDESLSVAVEARMAGFSWEATKSGSQDEDYESMTGKHKNVDRAPDECPVSSSTSAIAGAAIHSLSELNFTVEKGELLAVIGAVGSGKSSLLSALAGDMCNVEGQVRISGKRAYCPQSAWIQNASVRDNIIFGKPYVEVRYFAITDACALRQDIDSLPQKDDTEIGERGITLSGGQKQRLNLARAIYADADINLMDDPLSAVDSTVGMHIMDRAICGIMKDKSRILVTHQLHVLKRADRVLWLDEGKVVATGTFEDLMKTNPDFRKLMAATTQQEGRGEQAVAVQRPEEDAKGPEPTTYTIMQAEDRATRSISWSVWRMYLAAAGSGVLWAVVLVSLVASQGLAITTSLWLTYWVGNTFSRSLGFYIGIYAALGFVQAVFVFIFATLLSTAGTTSSKNMLLRAIARVVHAPMYFFDTTPQGRILNRFTKDVDAMDNLLTTNLRIYATSVAGIVSVCALIVAEFHYFAAALVPLLFIIWFVARYYRASAREVKRHESLLRSNLVAKYSEAVSGVQTIRAFGRESDFIKTIREAVDQVNSAAFLTYADQRWLAMRLDATANALVLVLGALVVTNRFDISPNISGLVLSYILSTARTIDYCVRQYAAVEDHMHSTERLYHYCTGIEQEAEGQIPAPVSWPTRGEITFSGVALRYRPELPLTLNGLTLNVKGGERLGVVGRTGAGKSSLATALFRIVELAAGTITVDGEDVSRIRLCDLRVRMTIITQDPMLFTGTIRSNLDPMNQHNDLVLWESLRQVGLIAKPTAAVNPSHTIEGPQDSDQPEIDSKSAADPHRFGLDTPVLSGGHNFSLGQRQQIALARALMRNSSIIMCDEATSNVDHVTEEQLQSAMRRAFAGKTMICIAHRLRTILWYDRICVLNGGKIAELGSPLDLYDRGGEFRKLCEESSIARDTITRYATQSAAL